jgi:hypothetical protein
MSSLARSVSRKAQATPARPAPVTPPAVMSEAEQRALKRRFHRVIGVTVACCAAAFAGMVGNVSLHQAWGMPLFILAMIGGFGAQIVFILGLVKAHRNDKGA